MNLDSKVKLIAVKGQDQLASLARTRVTVILDEERDSRDVLRDLKEKRGFMTNFLLKQWEEQKTLQLLVQMCMSTMYLITG